MAYLIIMLSFSQSITYVHQQTKFQKIQRTRLINSNTLTTFPTVLEQETWVSVYQKQDTVCVTHFWVIFLLLFNPVFQLHTKIST
jgi:hypothetical protein